VLVLERKGWPAAASSPASSYSGLLADEHSSVHIMIQGNPMIRDDDSGCSANSAQVRLQHSYAMIFADQSRWWRIRIWTAPARHLRVSQRADAETYRRFARRAIAMLRCSAPPVLPPMPLARLRDARSER